MIMFGLYITGEKPFEAVYLHGLIQDENGQKMSKSKGNVINPLEVAAEYGSDAFRMGIIMGESAGNNRPFDRSKVIGARNFCKAGNGALKTKSAMILRRNATDTRNNCRSLDASKLQQSVALGATRVIPLL